MYLLCVQVHVKRRDTYLFLLESYWSILNLSIFAKGNLLLRYIKPSTWGNQQGELPLCIKRIFGVVAGDSSLQDRGVAHYLLSLHFSLVSLPFSFYFCVPYKKYLLLCQ